VKAFDNEWFSWGVVGQNTLNGITKLLCEAVPSLQSKKITNKIERATRITQMEEACIPREKGMTVTRHRDAKSYGKYS